MKADYLTYARATSVSFIGLGVQATLAIVFFLYAFYQADHAALTASLFCATGILAWLCLAIVHDGHRRERVEAIEAEALGADGNASVFEAAGVETRPAARRVESLHKFFLPIASLIIAATLAIFAYVRFTQGSGLTSPIQSTDAANRGWVISIGLAVAFVGFVFARFVSGMAKQKPWAMLRAGASFAVGAAILGLAFAVSHFVDLAGPDVLVRYLPVAVPIFLGIVAAETVLNFLLILYRPRKTGEVAPPAFDSRILGFIAAPDKVAESLGEALNYQFGVDVSSTWFYRLFRSIATSLVLLGVVVIWALSSFVVIQPHQKALLLRNGNLVKVLEPGLHAKLPWPFDRVEIPRHVEKTAEGEDFVSRTVTGIRRLSLGKEAPEEGSAVLWTNTHAGAEQNFVVQPGRVTGKIAPARGELSLVSADVAVLYTIGDLEAYDRVATTESRDELLRAVAERELTIDLGSRSLNTILGPGREVISGEIRDRIQAAFDSLNVGPDGNPIGAGVKVLAVNVNGAHPPKRVAPNFERVIEAEQKRLASLEQAESDRVATLTEVVGSVALATAIVTELDKLESLQAAAASDENIATQTFVIEGLLESAGGEADSLIHTARAERWRRHMSERGRAAALLGQNVAYNASPWVYRSGLYLEALTEAMRDARVYVVSPDVENMRIDIDLQDNSLSGDLFQGTGDEDM